MFDSLLALSLMFHSGSDASVRSFNCAESPSNVWEYNELESKIVKEGADKVSKKLGLSSKSVTPDETWFQVKENTCKWFTVQLDMPKLKDSYYIVPTDTSLATATSAAVVSSFFSASGVNLYVGKVAGATPVYVSTTCSELQCTSTATAYGTSFSSSSLATKGQLVEKADDAAYMATIRLMSYLSKQGH